VTEKKTYAAAVDGVRIAVDDLAAPVLSALGKWSSYDESPSCAFEGLDKIYGYGSFEIQTYTFGGKDYIRSVYLIDDSVQTEQGITIGSTVEQVREAYGAPSKENEGSLQYAGEGMTLAFLIRDGRVTNIQYLKDVA
jgi:hypothetical protein